MITKNSNNKNLCYSSVFKAFAVLQLCSTDGRLTNELSYLCEFRKKMRDVLLNLLHARVYYYTLWFLGGPFPVTLARKIGFLPSLASWPFVQF